MLLRLPLKRKQEQTNCAVQCSAVIRSSTASSSTSYCAVTVALMQITKRAPSQVSTPKLQRTKALDLSYPLALLLEARSSTEKSIKMAWMSSWPYVLQANVVGTHRRSLPFARTFRPLFAMRTVMGVAHVPHPRAWYVEFSQGNPLIVAKKPLTP